MESKQIGYRVYISVAIESSRTRVVTRLGTPSYASRVELQLELTSMGTPPQSTYFNTTLFQALNGSLGSQ
jgi:hypothetical protein